MTAEEMWKDKGERFTDWTKEEFLEFVGKVYDEAFVTDTKNTDPEGRKQMILALADGNSPEVRNITYASPDMAARTAFDIVGDLPGKVREKTLMAMSMAEICSSTGMEPSQLHKMIDSDADPKDILKELHAKRDAVRGSFGSDDDELDFNVDGLTRH